MIMQKIEPSQSKHLHNIIKLLPDDKTHQKAVIDIWNKNFNGCNASYERFKWLYKENPSGQTQTWLLLTDTGKIVGCSSLFPRKLYVQNRSVLTWSAADLAVNKEHRYLGPALNLQRAIVKKKLADDSQFIFGHPNKAAHGLIKRVKYKAIGTETCWAKPLDPKEKIKKHIKNFFLVSVLSFFYSQFLELLYWKEKLLFAQSFHSKTTAHCDGAFDKLWDESCSEYGITPEKQSSYLNWRFASHKDREIQFYCLFDSEDNLFGYIAYSELKGVITVEDFCVRDIQKNSRMALLAFSREMKAAGYTTIMLSYLGDPFFQKILKNIFFFERGSGNTSFAYFHPESSKKYREFVLNEKNWFLVGDFDI